VSGTARLRFNGFRRTGDAERREEIGNGSTPRNGAGLIATEAAERPRPARISVSRPPNEWPITAGFWFRPLMTSSKWSATSPIDFFARTSGCSFASATVSGSSGHPGVTAA
jgi:hypothetical protein